MGDRQSIAWPDVRDHRSTKYRPSAAILSRRVVAIYDRSAYRLLRPRLSTRKPVAVSAFLHRPFDFAAMDETTFRIDHAEKFERLLSAPIAEAMIYWRTRSSTFFGLFSELALEQFRTPDPSS